MRQKYLRPVKCLTPYCHSQWDDQGLWIKGEWLCGKCWNKNSKTIEVKE